MVCVCVCVLAGCRLRGVGCCSNSAVSGDSGGSEGSRGGVDSCRPWEGVKEDDGDDLGGTARSAGSCVLALVLGLVLGSRGVIGSKEEIVSPCDASSADRKSRASRRVGSALGVNERLVVSDRWDGLCGLVSGSAPEDDAIEPASGDGAGVEACSDEEGSEAPSDAEVSSRFGGRTGVENMLLSWPLSSSRPPSFVALSPDSLRCVNVSSSLVPRPAS